MTTTATSPVSPSPTHHLSPSAAWRPSDNDHLIFKWIKLEGKTQSYVATAFGISQPTVSRIIQRYERWQAHASAREDGRLDHTERLRAQRWLTYERNEIFLASCTRLAKEMEGFTEVSKETVSRSRLRLDDPEKHRTETASVDRSGVAARFYRLAFRINMEQLKLVSLDPAPPAHPLSAEELAELESDAQNAAREIENAKHRADQQAQDFADAGYAPPAPFPTPETADTYNPNPYAWPVPQPLNAEPQSVSSSTTTTDSVERAMATTPDLTSFNPQSPAQEDSLQRSSLVTSDDPAPSPTSNLEPETWNLKPETKPALIHPLNNLNTLFTSPIAATPTPEINYVFSAAREKNLACLNNDSTSPIPLTILMPTDTREPPSEPPPKPSLFYDTSLTPSLAHPLEMKQSVSQVAMRAPTTI